MRAYAPEHLQPHRVKLGLVNVTFNGCIYCSIKKKKKTLIIKVLSIWQMNCVRKKLPFTEDLLCARHFTYVLSLNLIPH